MSSADVDVSFSAAELKRVRSLVQTVRAEKRLECSKFHIWEELKTNEREKEFHCDGSHSPLPQTSLSKAKNDP